MERRMKLECYPMDLRPAELVPGQPDREWMDKFTNRHPYRCLPLIMANTTGWELQCPMDFTAEWNGGPAATDITLKPDRPHPDFARFVESHFTGGVVTFHTGYLFRTDPGWAVWATGAPNHVKDGIQALTGLVETEWLPFPFTMNWIFTRPGRVRFKKGEPFCFITLIEHKRMEQVQPVMKSLDSDPTLRGQYEAWLRERDSFTKRLMGGDPDAAKQAWQRFYFKGELPEETGPAPTGHVNRRRLKPVKLF
jgi:hypothetical protein